MTDSANNASILDFEGAKAYALDRLIRDLSPDLTYHSLEHTRDDVLPSVERLGTMLGVDSDSLVLLKTAALYHDLGYVETRSGHEAVSIRIARDTLPRFGYIPAQLDRIEGMIMATKLPQTPHNLFEQIMADSDLDVFGREDFWKRNEDLRAEMAVAGSISTDEEWIEGQIAFVSAHHYFTSAAHQLRDAAKAQHIEELKKRLAAMRK